mgnify:FL=1
MQLPEAAPVGFVDTAVSLFEDDIYRLAAAGITRGCNPPHNTRFCPRELVTRGQMAAFLTRALGLPAGNGDTVRDDDSTIFENDIEGLHAAGITAGCNPPTNDFYCPSRNVTRAEMATFLSRGLELGTQPVPVRPFVIDVVDREEWGAASPRGAFTSHEIERITIHHAGDLDGPTGPAQFRSWQSWHHILGWADIAYHFIVGRDGNVYEGRPFEAVGDTATTYDPTGHILIVVEGNFDVSVPSEAQLEITAQLAAWASLQFDVPAATMSGHRDHAATNCPGDNLHPLIANGSIQARAVEIIARGGVTLREDGI